MAKIVIDPGHGGHDPGAVGAKSNEKTNVLNVGKKLRDLLKSAGHTVIMTRDSDKFISLSERAAIANRNKADVFISLHNNSASSSVATGFETFIYNGTTNANTASLQKAVHGAIAKNIGINDRGMKSANFAVVRETNMPAVLIEYAFINNPSDEAILINKVDELAKWTAEGILQHVGGDLGANSNNTTKPPEKPSNPTESKPKGDDKTGSIVVYLQSIGEPFSLAHRKKLAKEYGISNYTGTASQNTRLLSLLRGGKKPNQNVTSSKANLKVDGKLGKTTVKAIQKAVGAQVVDGVFSGQPNNATTRSFYSGISYGSSGSPSVKLLQKKVGAKADGKIGPSTVKALQKYLGTPQDGVISRPSSAMVVELQKRLNSGKF